MNAELESKIQKILDSRDDMPLIIKTILKKEQALAASEEILDVVYLNRSYADATKKVGVLSGATLLVATNYGLVAVEEGKEDLPVEAGGYRIRHILYPKIKCLDFNTCLLIGHLKVSTGLVSEPDLLVEFNSAHFYNDFAALVETIRGKMIEAAYKL
ncbi:MAG: hypothetical protein PHQ83_06590 [Eubacteriales bacterium]|nr:hypothetical protein [Eubacteriales bacterium]